MEQYLDAQEMQVYIMIQSVSSCATMATKVMVLKKEDVNTMEPGVDESLFVKVSSSIFTFR